MYSPAADLAQSPPIGRGPAAHVSRRTLWIAIAIAVGPITASLVLLILWAIGRWVAH
jgi:hypothetical protein